MQTGQNSIAPENSLPQLGQVRWDSVLMGLTALLPQSKPKATPRSTEWCEIGQHGPWQTFVPFHKQLRVHLMVARQIRFRNKIPTVGVLRRRVLMTTLTLWFLSRKKRVLPLLRTAGEKRVRCPCRHEERAFPKASQGRLFPSKGLTERVEELLASQRFAKALYL